MSARRDEGRLRSRRFVLAAAACLAHRAAAGQVPANVASPPVALPKVSPAAAKYQDTPHGGMTCEACTFFRRPHACQVVEGDISPSGWCQLFDMPD
jgi:hypothetical protein